MKSEKQFHTCLWAYKFELLGLILIIIASILTIIYVNSIGIASMFLVGLVLCAHKCLTGCVCKVCHPKEDEEGALGNKVTTTSSARKTPKI